MDFERLDMMVETRTKSNREGVGERKRSEVREYAFRPNHAFGLVILEADVRLWWLLSKNLKCIAPAGWWRW